MCMFRWTILLLLIAFAHTSTRGSTKTIARCGDGFLEDVDGYKVLHLNGTPYEMGFQEGWGIAIDQLAAQVAGMV